MTYRGGCHCGRIAFEVDGELTSVVDCNCSICTKSGFLHWRVEHGQLRMLTPWESLSTYVWGTGKARHYFCPQCGVAPVRVPRRNPAQFAVNIRCLEGVDPATVARQPFDGRAWELE